MARKRKRRPARGGLGQRIAVVAAIVVLVLCGASVTFSLFVKPAGDGSPRPLKVLIRNGSGVPGIAADAEAALRALEIDVVGVGNAERFDYRESILLVRRRNTDVRLLAELIGCENVTEQVKKDAVADAELILGADYRRLKLGDGR